MSPLGHKEICGLDVAMNNSLAVGCVQGVCNLDADIEQRLRLESPAKDHFPQSLAFQIFHHQKEAALVLANFVNGADIGVIQCRRGARFTESPQYLHHSRNWSDS